MNEGVVAVVDIGKSNLKILLAAPQGEAVDCVTRPNRLARSVPYPSLDLEALEAWIVDTLAQLAPRHDIRALVATAHGSAAVLCDDRGAVLPMMDYEAHLPAKVDGLYAKQAPSFAECCSGAGLGAMSLAKQLLYQSLYFPDAFARARRYLTLPQYLAWRWGGRAATEISQISAQSHLWSYPSQTPSGFLRARGWDRLLPPFAKAGEALGTVAPALAERTGLAPTTSVLCGVHDSNANLYRYKAAGMAGHALLSTGTWMIGYNRGRGRLALDPARGMIGNMDVDGDPVACTLTMTGREYALLDADSGSNDAEALHAVNHLLERGTFARPSFVDHDGCVPGSAGRGVVQGEPPRTPAERRGLASLYAAFTAHECLSALEAQSPVIIDGGFAGNLGFARLLAGLRPTHPVAVSRSRDGTALGAGLLWNRFERREPVRSVQVTTVEPYAHPALAPAVERWRAAWPPRGLHGTPPQ